MITLISTWKRFLALGLEEDSIAFDWTARATEMQNPANPKAKSISHARLIAKENGIWAAETGLKALNLLSQEMGMPLQIESKIKDGAFIQKGETLCEWSGEAQAILVFERSFINLAAYACGIATQAHALVQKVKDANLNPEPRIVPTRKTLPGFRDLAIQSALIGGAHPHRLNLSGGLLLKENHIAAAGGIAKAVSNARETAPHLLKIEIEVRNFAELKEAIQAGTEVIMLDNFTPAQIKDAIQIKPKNNTLFEVSGGINLSNLDSYLIPGVDVISIGSITHSVKALDLSLIMTNVKAI